MGGAKWPLPSCPSLSLHGASSDPRSSLPSSATCLNLQLSRYVLGGIKCLGEQSSNEGTLGAGWSETSPALHPFASGAGFVWISIWQWMRETSAPSPAPSLLTQKLASLTTRNTSSNWKNKFKNALTNITSLHAIKFVCFYMCTNNHPFTGPQPHVLTHAPVWVCVSEEKGG